MRHAPETEKVPLIADGLTAPSKAYEVVPVTVAASYSGIR